MGDGPGRRGHPTPDPRDHGGDHNDGIMVQERTGIGPWKGDKCGDWTEWDGDRNGEGIMVQEGAGMGRKGTVIQGRGQEQGGMGKGTRMGMGLCFRVRMGWIVVQKGQG